jgi:peptide/nickel transport system permease protein
MTLLFVVVFNFFLFRVMPGDPIGLFHRGLNQDTAQIQKLRAALNKPLWEQFVTYIQNPFAQTIDSTKFSAPVWGIIGDRFWPTVLLMGTSITLATIIGVWIGIRAGWNRGSTFDKASTGITLALYSMPEFWLGLVLLIVFSVKLDLFPTGGMVSPGTDMGTPAGWLNVLWHLTLPCATLTLVYLAEYSLIMRASMVDETGQDYLTTARAKGLMDRMVRRKHAVPNARLPTMTLIFMNLGFVVGGAITVETVFSWPGLGLLSYEAIRGPDVPLLQAIFLLFSCAVIIANVAADILYAYLDPRVRA